MNRLNGLYLLNSKPMELIYGEEEQRDVAKLVDIYAPPQTAESIKANPSLLKYADVIFSGWGAPVMDQDFLDAAPNLKAVFYGAGSIRHFITDAFWNRGIVITSGYAANAIPVAEYTLGAIMLGLKRFWHFATELKNGGGWWTIPRIAPEAYHATVGLISFGMVARKTLELLKPFEMNYVVYCPFLSQEEARRLNIRLCTLPELFECSDVVSLHTPDLPETRGMITGALIASMKHGATFINTARGAVVHEQEMIEILRRRPDITAILDVTHPEPPTTGSPLFTLPNVIVTPHISGPMGPALRRNGRYMVDELHRYVAGEPLKWQITKERAGTLA